MAARTEKSSGVVQLFFCIPEYTVGLKDIDNSQSKDLKKKLFEVKPHGMQFIC